MFKYRDGVCLETGDGSCASANPLTCDEAEFLNPHKACARLMVGSYCKGGGNARVCHGIGTGVAKRPCRIGMRGCDASRPFSCDSAIILPAH